MTSNANAASPLLQLPPELLVRVASYVTTPELGHLRRVCKDIESRLFESFAYEFFHKRQFMIEEPSLEALVGISKHPTLSKRLTEVIISTTSYGEVENLQSMTAQKLFLRGYTNRELLVSSGQARDMLVEAFTNLPNLHKVGVRDYDAKGRFRDGDTALWKSYGHSLMEGEAARALAPDQPFILLLHAIGLSGANVPSLEVFLRHHWRLSDRAFDVLSTRMTKLVRPVLAQLTTLMLTLCKDLIFPFSPATQRSDLRLKKFLHHTPAVERLRLNFDDGTSPLLDWLSLRPKTAVSQTQPAPADYTLPVPLAYVTTLELGMVRVSTSTLMSILDRFELRTFTLWRVTLDVDSRAQIKPADGPNYGTKFMEMLAKASATQHVHRAMLGFIKVNAKSDTRHRRYDVDFPPANNSSTSSNNNNKSDGSGTRGSKPAGKSWEDLKAKHLTISFSRGGSAPSFGVWAKEMATQATMKVLRGGSEVQDVTDHDWDSEDSSELDDIEAEDDDEDEEEDE